jgi:nucleoside-diphosphate-sugar epimerase
VAHLFYKGKSILVTGGTGFIGLNLVEKLVAEQADIRCLVQPSSDLTRLQKISPHIHIIEGDMRSDDPALWTRATAGVDVIFHLAAAGVATAFKENQDIPLLVDTNVLGLARLARGARESGVRRLVISSSFCEYGNTEKAKISPDDPLTPKMAYAASKAGASMLGKALSEHMEVVILRSFHPYGPYEAERRLVPFLIRNAFKGEVSKLTKGEQVWDFVYVKDVAEAFLAAGEAVLPERYLVLNVGTGKGISVAEVAKALASILPSAKYELGAIPYKTKDLWHMVPDVSRTKDVLGWEAKEDIRSGLKKTVEWFKKND